MEPKPTRNALLLLLALIALSPRCSDSVRLFRYFCRACESAEMALGHMRHRLALGFAMQQLPKAAA